MQRLMLVKKSVCQFFSMNTTSGRRGFMMVCKQWTKLVKVRWLKNDPLNSEALETCRSMIRQLLGCFVPFVVLSLYVSHVFYTCPLLPGGGRHIQ